LCGVAKLCALFSIFLSVFIAGCGTAGYYWQSASGHLSLLARRVPVDEVLLSAATSDETRARLSAAREAREFAVRELGLPDNRSYRDFVSLDAPYVVWNVVVAPALSLRPQVSCFLVVGCIAYRGYYAEQDALAEAARWRAQGRDVYVGGVRAYSTLGWFADPLLSSMLAGPGTYAPRVIFHELAHQVVYIRNDTAFNEAFAVAVEREGVERWVRQKADSDAAPAYRRSVLRQAQFLELVRGARADLDTIYGGPSDDPSKRLSKGARFAQLRADYAKLRDEWDGYTGYDRWFAQDLNNAKLALLATYTDLVPAFTALLANNEGDFARFYAQVQRLGSQEKGVRDAELAILREQAKRLQTATN
jgi:predicted aminopeptidase